MNAVRMNYLHLFNEYVVFLHPSAFRYAPLPNPSSWSCTSPQLHATLSAFHPCSLLSTLSAPYILFGTGMKVLSGDGNVEAWRGAEKRKSCGEVKNGKIPSSGARKWSEQIQYRLIMPCPLIWYQFLATFSTLHPSFHPRSTQPFHPSNAPFHPHPSTYFTPFRRLCPL